MRKMYTFKIHEKILDDLKEDAVLENRSFNNHVETIFFDHLLKKQNGKAKKRTKSGL